MFGDEQVDEVVEILEGIEWWGVVAGFEIEVMQHHGGDLLVSVMDFGFSHFLEIGRGLLKQISY